MLVLVGKLTVNLIGKDVKILFYHNLGYRLKVLFLHDGTGWIIGEREHQYLGLVRNLLQNLLSSKPEFIFLFELNNHRLCISQNSAWFIGNIAGLRDQNLIPLIDHCSESKVYSFRTTDCNKNLTQGIIVNSLRSLHVSSNLFSQFYQTGIGSIESPALFKRVNTLIPYMPWSIKIRLANTEGNSALCLVNNIKELSDSRWFYVYNFTTDRISHGDTISLVSSYLFVRIVP